VVVSAPLLIGDDVRAELAKLRTSAADKPVDMPALIEQLKTKDGRRRHKDAMTRQTVIIPGPWPFYVTYSIETGHPCGTCRHMSMSIGRKDRVPHPVGVWMVAEELGFSGGLGACVVWPEPLSDGGVAINVVQPLPVAPASAA
jgi:hypothetical protein